MAHYSTQTAVNISDVSPEGAERAQRLYDQLREAGRAQFDLAYLEAEEELLLTHADTCREEHVAAFICLFLQSEGREDAVLFEVAYVCSRPRPGAFGGAALRVTAEGWQTLTTGDVHSFLKRGHLREECEALREQADALREAAAEYAEMGRAFPTTGAGGLGERLGGLRDAIGRVLTTPWLLAADELDQPRPLGDE